MKRLLIRSLLFLAIIVGCFLAARYFFLDSGYVLIAYNGYTIESSLWAMLLALFIAFVGFKILFAVLRTVASGTGVLLPMTARARRRRAQRMSNRGLIQFANGHWKRAQRLLGQAGDAGSVPLLNYLLAARAASSDNDLDAYKEFLRKADKATPRAFLAIGITQAEIQLSHKQLEQALATLSSLRKKAPKHPYVLKLLKQAYEQLSDWQALADLLPTLRKQKVFNNSELEHLEQQVYNELFEQAWNKGRNLPDAQRTKPADDIWASLSKAQRRNEDLVLSYANCLHKLNAQEEAEAFIRRQLPSLYNQELIRIYGQLKASDSSRQLLAGEKLLAERPNDPELLLALGRISSRAQLWGKSREYLETSLKLRHSAATYNELGQLLAHLGEHEKSSGYFQQGLALAAERT
ncbi:heme biosynthesis HemY N-terminal domain-containing protein [Parendozoicomonas haliclonae]|uniref:Putative protoheme IX biogenesis protein n=1 Tax=Parendozoicomonas haliclonae TaxID=1960125 RepID=A0A1X7AIZ9_9GAMM|nr:heme biosynthesis HemY N-terminal domain-containing protein [Parendozoicomonas haliclonae]SMA45831.1 putative protoheme IX biogenesis protein [Parendozoicomonas haliclonae]